MPDTAIKLENGDSSAARDPSGFLSTVFGAPVTVKLNSGVVYKGSPPSSLAASPWPGTYADAQLL